MRSISNNTEKYINKHIRWYGNEHIGDRFTINEYDWQKVTDKVFMPVQRGVDVFKIGRPVIKTLRNEIIK
jgi:hypothetical protein